MPLYTLQPLKSGLYKSFKSFASQEPDVQIDTTKSGNYLEIWEDKKKRFVPMRPNEVPYCYAFVRNGKAYVFTPKGVMELKRSGMDWVFESNLEGTSASGASIGAAAGAQYGFVGGFVGSLMGSALDPGKGTFQYIIDYENGDFIKGERIKKEK